MQTWLKNNRKIVIYGTCAFFGGVAFRLLNEKSDLAMYSALAILAITLFTIYKTSKRILFATKPTYLETRGLTVPKVVREPDPKCTNCNGRGWFYDGLNGNRSTVCPCRTS
jgi:hypothetical protein